MTLQQCDQVNQHIIDDFVERLAVFGFDRFYYAIVTDEDYPVRETLGCCSDINGNRAVNLRRMRFAVASDKRILLYRDEYMQRFSSSDETFASLGPELRKRHNPFIWPENRFTPRLQNSFQQFQRRFDVDTRAIYYYLLADRPGWLGVCHLFSALSREQVLEKIVGREDELKSLLSRYCETFNALSLRSINPLANLGVLSPTCVKILSLVAEGNSSEEVGKRLYLSERGVNYHLDRARDILKAKNRANLVSKSYQKGLL